MASLSYFIIFIVHFVAIYCQRLPYDGAENELTITIPPAKIECFYQKAEIGNTLELEYQVYTRFFEFIVIPLLHLCNSGNIVKVSYAITKLKICLFSLTQKKR